MEARGFHIFVDELFSDGRSRDGWLLVFCVFSSNRILKGGQVIPLIFPNVP